MNKLPSAALVPQRTSPQSTSAPVATLPQGPAKLGATAESPQDSFGRLESLLESHQVLLENHAPDIVVHSIRDQVVRELRLLQNSGTFSGQTFNSDSDDRIWFQQLLDQLRASKSASWQNQSHSRVLAESSAENPNPVLRVGFDGVVLDGNPAGAAFLEALTTELGGYPLEVFRKAITTMLDQGSSTILDLQCDDRDYSLTVAPVSQADYVYLYGHDVSDIKQAQRQAQELAMHDPLTGLPNRVLLKQRFDKALIDCWYNNTTLAVVFVDLDNFKQINDNLGHRTGDQTLTTVAKHLSEAVRDRDTVARWGGDEFVVLLPGLDQRDVEAACERLREHTQQQAARDEKCFVTLSVGLASYPEDGRDAEALLQAADERLLKAKKARERRLKANTKAITFDF